MEQERAARGSRSQRRCPLRVFIYTVPENPMDSAPLHPRCPSQGKEGNKGGKGTQKGQGSLESKREKKIMSGYLLVVFGESFKPPPSPPYVGIPLSDGRARESAKLKGFCSVVGFFSFFSACVCLCGTALPELQQQHEQFPTAWFLFLFPVP